MNRAIDTGIGHLKTGDQLIFDDSIVYKILEITIVYNLGDIDSRMTLVDTSTEKCVDMSIRNLMNNSDHYRIINKRI